MGKLIGSHQSCRLSSPTELQSHAVVCQSKAVGHRLLVDEEEALGWTSHFDLNDTVFLGTRSGFVDWVINAFPLT